MKIRRKITISKSLLLIFILTLFYGTSFYNNNIALGATNITSITTSSSVLNLIAGGPTANLTAKVLPGNAVDKSVTWRSSNPAIATVSATGVVTPISDGMVAIAVTTVDGAHTAYCIVNVTTQSVTGISLSKNQATLKVGATVTLSPVITPSDASNTAVHYSSNNPAVASVTSAGIVTATGFGNAIISVATVDRGFTTIFVVNVPQTVSSITMSQTSLKFNIGDSPVKLLATLKPDTLSVKDVIWSTSDSSIATVDSNGNVTPRFAGTAVITATSALDITKKATCNVTVGSTADTKIHPGGITLNLHQKVFNIGDKFTLTEIITPTTAASKAVAWNSINPAVATVSSTGVVTAIATGNTLIMVTTVDGNKTDGCFVTVNDQTVTGISLAKNQSTLKIGATVTLKPVITPSDASNAAVHYNSNNPAVASVTSAGVVTATGFGNAIISVSTIDRGFTTLFFISVPKPATSISITLSRSSLKFNVGDAGIMLTATLRPSNITPNITWTSSNSSIATVSSNGRVTPVSGGTAVITATSVQDSTKKATCSVTVVQRATGVTIN